MTPAELKTLVPGQKVKVIDYVPDDDGVDYNFAGPMSQWCGCVVTVLEQLPDDDWHILIREDAGRGMTRRGCDGKMHYVWRYNVLEFVEDAAAPDDTASDDDVLNVLFS